MWKIEPYTGFSHTILVDKGEEIPEAFSAVGDFEFAVITGIGEKQGSVIRYDCIETHNAKMFIDMFEEKHKTKLWTLSCYPAPTWAVAERMLHRLTRMEEARAIGKRLRTTSDGAVVRNVSGQVAGRIAI